MNRAGNVRPAPQREAVQGEAKLVDAGGLFHAIIHADSDKVGGRDLDVLQLIPLDQEPARARFQARRGVVEDHIAAAAIGEKPVDGVKINAGLVICVGRCSLPGLSTGVRTRLCPASTLSSPIGLKMGKPAGISPPAHHQEVRDASTSPHPVGDRGDPGSQSQDHRRTAIGVGPVRSRAGSPLVGYYRASGRYLIRCGVSASAPRRRRRSAS